MAKCRICGNEAGNHSYELKELMYGYEEKFQYFQCSNCYCLQIYEIPEHIGRFYPEEYYSFSSGPKVKSSPIAKFIQYHRFRQSLFGNDLLGSILAPFLKKSPVLETMKNAGIKENMKVLDIGCGAGLILYLMRLAGMKNLTGIDPFIKDNIIYDEHLSILKKDIHEINGKWDFILVNHVLEHIDDQFKFLKEIYDKLNKGGICLIRIPTSSSYSWEHYQENWIQLDPPRHFYLHSLKSIDALVSASNLKIKEIIFDSTDFQFIGSEQSIKGIALESDQSYLRNKSSDLFSGKQIKEFKQRATELNRQNKGDQIAVVVTHIE